MSRPGARAIPGLAVGWILSGCVSPQLDDTGLALAWRLVETEPSDGPSALRARTCRGARAAFVVIRARPLPDPLDEADEPAHSAYADTWPCRRGEGGKVFGEPHDSIFVGLDPGGWAVAGSLYGSADDLAAPREPDDELTVVIARGQLAFGTLELAVGLGQLELALAPAECELASLELQYAAGERDLFEPAAPPPTRYREALRASAIGGAGSLPLGGGPFACAGVGGSYLAVLDAGAYRLVPTRDGQPGCPLDVVIERGQTTTLALDLAQGPC